MSSLTALFQAAEEQFALRRLDRLVLLRDHRIRFLPAQGRATILEISSSSMRSASPSVEALSRARCVGELLSDAKSGRPGIPRARPSRHRPSKSGYDPFSISCENSATRFSETDPGPSASIRDTLGAKFAPIDLRRASGRRKPALYRAHVASLYHDVQSHVRSQRVC